MTIVSDENREELMTIVENMFAEPATCLGQAVKAGIEVSNNMDFFKNPFNDMVTNSRL